MKRPSLLHLTWAILATSTFLIGYWAGSLQSGVQPTAVTRSIDAKTGTPSSELGLTASVSETASDVRGEATKPAATWTPEELRTHSFQIVSEPGTRIAKNRQLCELLAHITPENWKQALEGFEAGMKAKSSGGGELYSLLLEHIAAIGGAAALEHAISPDRVSDRGRTFTMLKGWADAHPKECVAWYLAQPDAIQVAYWGHFVAGVGRNDPKAAIELTFAGKRPVYGNGTGTAVLNNAFVTIGATGLEDAFTSLRSRNDVSTGAKREFFRNLTNKQVASLPSSPDRGERLLRWFDAHAGQPYVSAEQSSQVFRVSAQSNPSATLAWLESNSGKIDAETSETGFGALGREWQMQAPEKLSEWIQGNSTHPRHDTVLEAAVGSLSEAKQFDAAMRLADSIRDETKRTHLITTLQQSIAGPSPQK